MAESNWEWPFSRPELMAGLRRYLAASSLRLLDIKEIPLPATMPGATILEPGTKLSAMSVGVQIEGVKHTLPLLLKEPPVNHHGWVLRGIGQREYGVYRRLAQHLPLLVPGLVVGDENSGWFILEVLTGLRSSVEWAADDYLEAIQNMVKLHDRFWDSSLHLKNYPWLARPLDADFEDTYSAAAEAALSLKARAQLPWLDEPDSATVLDQIINAPRQVIAPLAEESATLIHGDYWPGNIARPIDGRQIVFDWQMAGIGPAIFDMVWFIQKSRFYLKPPLSPEAMIRCYQEQADQLFKPGWDDERFKLLWDHALMWLFMSNWLGKLAAMPQDSYARIDARFRHVWLEPLCTAVSRRL